jgi:hypothetical protein
MAGKRKKLENIVLKLLQVDMLQGQDKLVQGKPPAATVLMRFL